MIIDPDGLGLANCIEQLLDAVPDDIDGQVKPELLQPVLEIATSPCDDVRSAGEQLRGLRRTVAEVAERCGVQIAAAGTHPFACWEDALVVERPRYEQLANELAFIARQELIFGTHVHVAIEGPDRAIYVADGIRRYLPLMLAMSVNSPFWRGQETGVMSTRTPIFRAFPRVGVPPHYGTWEVYSNRVEMMMRAGAIEDYTFLWWDVRPHPNLGTVEARIFDQQTKVEHTIALAALVAALAHRLSALYDAEEPLVEYPSELVDDNKVRAALKGMDGVLMDFRAGRQIRAEDQAGRLLDELRPHAEELDCVAELDVARELLEGNTGAERQLRVYRQDPDLQNLVREMVVASRA